MQEPTLFTKIIQGEIPCHKIYEDDHTFAFLDIHPITPGHVLIVPKKQVEFVWDLDEKTYQALMATTKKLALHLRATLGVTFIGEQVIGVDVPHAHIHLIPFMSVADYHAQPDMTSEPNHEALAIMAEKLYIS